LFLAHLLLYNYNENNPDLAPSLNLGYESISTHSIEANSERYARAVGRSRKRAFNIHEGDPAADIETVIVLILSGHKQI
jgi:hypothetical protein